MCTELVKLKLFQGRLGRIWTSSYDFYHKHWVFWDWNWNEDKNWKKKILSQKVANLLRFSAICTHFNEMCFTLIELLTIFVSSRTANSEMFLEKTFALMIYCTMENCSMIIITSYTSYTWSFHTFSMHQSQNTGKFMCTELVKLKLFQGRLGRIWTSSYDFYHKHWVFWVSNWNEDKKWKKKF